MSRTLGIEDVCNERAVKAAHHIQKFLLLSGAESEQPLLVLYLGTGWKVFGGFEGCERIPLEEIDPEFGCLPEVKDHPNELVYVPNLEETGVAAIVLRGRPHLYQKWFKQVGDDHLVEVSAKYLVRLHTEMIVTLGLVEVGSRWSVHHYKCDRHSRRRADACWNDPCSPRLQPSGS